MSLVEMTVLLLACLVPLGITLFMAVVLVWLVSLDRARARQEAALAALAEQLAALGPVPDPAAVPSPPGAPTWPPPTAGPAADPEA